MHILAQITTEYESMGVKTMLVLTIIALGTVIAYLYKSKESVISDKDNRILTLEEMTQAWEATKGIF